MRKSAPTKIKSKGHNLEKKMGIDINLKSHLIFMKVERAQNFDLRD